MNLQFKLVPQKQVIATKKAKREEAVKEMTSPFDVVATKKTGMEEEAEEITIPFDVVAEFILPSVAARDLVRFRSVWKSWRQLIDDPNFIHNYLRRHDLTLHQERPPSFTSIRNQHHVHQVIAYCSGYRKMGPAEPQGLYCMDMNCYRQMRPTERGGLYCMDIKCEDTNGRIKDNGKPIKILGLEDCPKDAGFNMLPPCKGLVLFKNNSAPLYLCNPATGESTSLPQPSTAALRWHGFCYGFGFDDHSKEFKVLHVWDVHDDEDEVYYHDLRSLGKECFHEILSLGKDCSWRQLGRLPFRWYNCNSLHPGIPFNSSLHWIVCACEKTWGDNSLMAFDLRKEEFKRKALPLGLDKAVYLSLSLITLAEGCLGLTRYKVGGEAGNIGLDVWVLGDYESEIWTKRHRISFASIGHGLGDVDEEEEDVSHSDCDSECFPDHYPRILIMGEHEILLPFIGEALMLLYDLEQKTSRKFVVDGDEEMFLSERPSTYVYEQHLGSAYFVSALRSWSIMISLREGQDRINADASPV